MILRCLITDNDPEAVDVLTKYITMVPQLELVAHCNTIDETLTLLQACYTDILFINIPSAHLDALKNIRLLKTGPSIIFTSADANHAYDAFESDAVDYLLKPFSLERFMRAVEKVQVLKCHKLGRDMDDFQFNNIKKFFFIKSSQDMVKVSYDDILFIEGMENYVKIHCNDRTVISFTTMKNMEELLAPHRFLRIHRSCIINLEKVDAIQNHTFKIKNKELITGKSYKKAVAELLKTYSI